MARWYCIHWKAYLPGRMDSTNKRHLNFCYLICIEYSLRCFVVHTAHLKALVRCVVDGPICFLPDWRFSLHSCSVNISTDMEVCWLSIYSIMKKSPPLWVMEHRAGGRNTLMWDKPPFLDALTVKNCSINLQSCVALVSIDVFWIF